MKMKIHAIEGKGNLDKEVIWLDVVEDIAELKYYMVCDTTYTDDKHISNELRHVYWFRSKSVKKGDWIALHTKNGTNSTNSNNRGGTTHHFYWNLGRTIWNKDGDAAVLFKVDTWNTLRG
jgi:hypothetical protein